MISLISLALLIGILQLLFYAAYTVFRTVYLSPLLKIPGLAYGPLYGNVKEAMVGEAMESSVKWVRKYGSIVRFYQLFGKEAVLVADAEAIRHILVTNSRNYPRYTNPVLSRLVPHGLISIEGPIHRATRKSLNPSFGNSALREFMPHFHQAASRMVSRIHSLMKVQQRIEVERLIKEATMTAIGLTVFDTDFGLLTDKEKTNEEVEALIYIMSQQRQTLLSRLPFYRRLPFATNIKYNTSLKVVHRLCLAIIQRNSLPGGDSNMLKRLLATTFEGQDGNKGLLSNSQIKDHVLTFMVAGHETSTYSAAWLLLELARNPSIQDKLYEEVLSTDPTSIDIDTLDSLTYLDACIKEALRLHPPVSSVSRRAKCDDVIAGYKIPAGTDLVVHTAALMRTCVPDGDEFKPERFLDGEFKGKFWLPFSIGPHACIGNKFALLEMKVLVLYLLQQFELSPVPGLVIRKRRILIVRPSPPVELILSNRSLSSF
ncbi:uncharacterized protein [Watersipora subatra]|uniref:uncharacterized protein n=1 Tax=Watersipora subatra TaxID=2589382 RepID=UPI00355B55BC